jgi:hypothetical protein
MIKMKNIIIVAIILLILAIFPLPYGYYQFLKITICGILGYIGYQEYNKNKDFNVKCIIMWLFAIAYNPILKISLGRKRWAIVNVITIAVFLIFYGRKYFVKTNKDNNDEKQ